jgi:hypothetical protein
MGNRGSVIARGRSNNLEEGYYSFLCLAREGVRYLSVGGLCCVSTVNSKMKKRRKIHEEKA